MNRISAGLIKNKSLIIIFILFVFCISVYSSSLSCGFVYDDNYLILNNPYIKEARFIPQAFSKCLYNVSNEFTKPDYYRPLQTLSLALDYRLWRTKPFGYHLTNVLIHFLNSALLFIIIYIIFDNLFVAALSSIFFCVHPINTTAVTYISGRADLLSGFFILSVLLFTVLGLRYQKTRKLYFYLIILFTILALFSRENALFIPLGVLLLSVFIKGDRKYKFALFFSTALTVGLYLLFRARLLNMPIAQYTPLYLNPFFKVINFFYAIIYYVSLLFIPANPHLMRTTLPILSIGDIRLWLTLLFSGALIAFFYSKRKDRMLIFGLIWFFIFAIQVFLLMDKFSSRRLSVREHWIYLSSAGFYIIISLWFYIFKRKHKVFTYTLAASVLLILIYFTVADNAYYKKDLILSRHLLKYEPDNTEIYKTLIGISLENKEYDKAFQYLEKATEISRDDPELYLSKCRYYECVGDTQKAISEYEELLRIAPKSGRASNNLGALYFDMGDYDKAREFFKKAIALNPLLFEPYANMAKLSYKKGNINDAVYFYKKTISLNPDDRYSFTELAKIYIKEKYLKDALDLLNSAYSHGHVTPSILMMLGVVNDELGREKIASDYFRKALALNPKSQEIMLNLGIFYANHNQLDKAVKIWKDALALKPDNEMIKENLKKAGELEGNSK